MVYGNFKNLARKTAPDKLLHDKALNISNSIMHIKGKGRASIV